MVINVQISIQTLRFFGILDLCFTPKLAEPIKRSGERPQLFLGPDNQVFCVLDWIQVAA